MRDKVYNNKDRNKKISVGVRNWIKAHPEEHRIHMNKINKNPEKIRKMAETHTGMKRTDSAKKNILRGISDYYKNSIDGGAARSGKGCMYIHNIITRKSKRIKRGENIPDGWKQGSGKRNG